MKRIGRYTKEHPIGLSLLVLLGIGLLIGMISAAVTLVSAANGLGTIASRVEQSETLESSLELEKAGDGTYLVYALLRGDQVLYDDHGKAVLYLQEKRKGKDGTTHYETIFTAKQFYLDGIAVEKPAFHTLYNPDFDAQYGRNNYRGLWHCEWGTFLVKKEADAYRGVTFFPFWEPQRVREQYAAGGGGNSTFWMLFGSLASICACAAGMAVVIAATTRRYVCPGCGKQLKKNGQCETCLEYAVRQRETQEQAEEKPRSEANRPTPKPLTEKEKKKLKRDCIFGVIAIAFVVMLLVSDVQRSKRIAASGSASTYAYRPVISENVFREYPYTAAEARGYSDMDFSRGEPVELRLTGGVYIVGVHIPEGQYAMETENPFDALIVMDHARQIYLYEYEAKQPNNLNDLRLYSGALVEVQTKTSLTLKSGHALTDTMRSIVNPLTESVALKAGTSVSGQDFPEGIYDLRFDNEEACAAVAVEDPNSEEDTVRRIEAREQGETWANMVLPANARVEVTGGTLTLQPSERIFSTCYAAYYEMYN